MKILIVANTSWSIYNFRAGLICKLISEGHSITTLAPDDSFTNNLNELGCTHFNLKLSPKGINPISDIALIIRLIFIYSKIKPDIIFHYTIKPNIYGSIAAFITGSKSIAVTTGLGYTFIKNNLISKIARILYKVAFIFPEEIWFLNKDDKESFISYNIINDNKAKLLHGEGVNLAHFHPTEKPIIDEKFRFLLIARMLWDKGIGEYVTAARKIKAKHQNVIFQLLGSCEVANPSAINRQQIAEWEREGVIEYKGVTDDVRPFISQSDCVVLPSYREGLSRTLIESSAMARPLITTDVPGCRDVVRDGVTGFICALRDNESLAECFDRMIEKSNCSRVEMGIAGRRFMEKKFDERIIIQEYLNTLLKYK